MKVLNKEKIKEDISVFAPNKRRVKKIKDNFFGQFAICLICLFFFALIIYRDEIYNYFAGLGKKTPTHFEFSLPFNAKRQNILLMGVDISGNPDNPFENTRSDSIYLITLAPHAKSANVISIPRDSKVYIPSRKTPEKINHAFAYGGIDLSKKTIEQTLGVHIDRYIVISNHALTDFIDKIGGLDVYVENNMRYDDYSANLHINLQKGVQHLDGKAAEGYMRYRKDGLGDIGRIRRQQWFLSAFADKMKEPSVIIKIPEILKSVSKYIQTDFSAYELAQYAALLKSMDLSRIKVTTLPGEPSQRGIISYWILDPKGVQETIDSLVYNQKPRALDRALEAGILYAQSEETAALELQKRLEDLGIKTSARQVKNPGHDYIAVHNFDVSSDSLNMLKTEIPSLRENQIVYDIIGINKAARDFTIIMAGSH